MPCKNMSSSTVWSGPSLSTNRIIRYYRMYEWKAKALMILCACAGWADMRILHLLEGIFWLDTAHTYLILFRTKSKGLSFLHLWWASEIRVKDREHLVIPLALLCYKLCSEKKWHLIINNNKKVKGQPNKFGGSHNPNVLCHNSVSKPYWFWKRSFLSAYHL